MTIDPHAPTPLYRQLALVLAGRIRAGEIEPNRPVPTEATLMWEYGVARGTARRAVGLLRNWGLAVTVHGKGTYVAPNEGAEDPL